MDHEHDTHHVNYLAILIVLCVLTALSVAFDVVDIRGTAESMGMNGTIVLAFCVLAVSTAKALCVMMFFMHLKFERNWKYVLLAPTTILALGLPLALLPDVGVHYYTVDVPQVYEQPHEDGHATPESETPHKDH